MAFGLRPVLDRYRIFASEDVDATCGFLESKNFKLEHMGRQVARIDARFNGVYMPGMYLGYIQYGPEVAVRATARDDFWLQLPLQGQLDVISSRTSVACSIKRAGIASPCRNDYYLVKSGEGCGGIRISLTKSALLKCLASLLGEQPRLPLEFAHELDISTGHGRTLVQYLLMAVRDFDSPGAVPWSEAMLTAFEQFIMTMLLSIQPHNFSAALQRLDKQLAPRDVRRAVDYIHARLDSPLIINDIIAATGVPGRTLFKHFKDFLGVSPMQYLRNARFDRVRQRFLQADPGASITQIAMDAGFLHMGRFSVEYRRRFGERPSETLQRRRRRH